MGVKLGIEGEKEFKNALRDINNSFKVLGSELNLVSSQFDKNDKSIEAITARNKVLNKEIDTQKEKIDTLEKALHNAATSFGDADKRTQAWQVQLNNAKAELNNMQKELKQNDTALNNVADEFNDAEKQSEQFNKALKKTADTADHSGGSFSKLGSVLGKIGVGLGAGVLAIGTAAVGAAAGLAKMSISAAENADQIQTTAEVYGLSAERVQELTYVGTKLDVELETITKAQTKVTKAMFESKDGTGATAEAFKQLGISVVGSDGKLRDSKVVMGEALTALGKMSNEKVVPHGYYYHANDPSVLIKDGTWYMALSTVRWDMTECISIITSTNGTTWPALTGTDYEVTVSGVTINTMLRPSLIWNVTNSRWELYFDGRVNGSTSNEQYLAYCTEATPKNFVYQCKIGDMVEADIKYVNGQYIAAYRSYYEVWPPQIHASLSSDGIAFTNDTVIVSPDPLLAYDNSGVTNAGWAIDNNTIYGVMFGGTDNNNFMTHKIGLALPQSLIWLRSDGGAAWHGWNQALDANRLKVYTGTYNTVDYMAAYNKSGLILEQTYTSNKGDVYSIVDRTFTNTTRTSAWASSHISGFEETKSIDSSNATMYSSLLRTSQNSVEWLAVDMGSSKTVKRLKIVPRGDALCFPVDFKLQYSNEGSVWYDIPSQNYVGFTAPSTERIFAFDAPINARYLRIYATKLGSDGSGNYYMQIVEMHPQE